VRGGVARLGRIQVTPPTRTDRRPSLDSADGWTPRGSAADGRLVRGRLGHVWRLWVRVACVQGLSTHTERHGGYICGGGRVRGEGESR